MRGNTGASNLTEAADTRSIHGFLFKGLTPQHFDYYAGHYRGEPLRCLDSYSVHIPSDPRVGYDPANVPHYMDEFASRLRSYMLALDAQLALNGPHVDSPMKLVAYVSGIAAFFVEFLECHPYANGNGHMARFMLIALLARRGVYPTNEWRIDPRPADPPYSNLIARYRDGEKDPLVLFILNAL